MSLHDEFQVTLPSNVTGLGTNTPGAYETTLAFPLELPSTWEFALIDITYPHTWLDIETNGGLAFLQCTTEMTKITEKLLVKQTV